jgi:RTX calcium-binding nonapeptide repeat (4 copies)
MVLTGVLVPPAAGAAVATMVEMSDRYGLGAVFTLTAAPGERNTVTLRGDGDDVLVSDSTAPLVAGRGCQAESGAIVRCPSPLSPLGLDYVGETVDLGDGDDAVTADPMHGVSVQGGPGDDVLTGGRSRDDLTGGPGADTVLGGEGNDRFVDGDVDEPDRYDGGEGVDSLAFYGRVRPLRLDLGAGTTSDGDVLAGIEDATGGEGDDVLAGSDAPNVLWGSGGRDVIVGRGGDDELHGGPAADGVDGGEGNDGIEGGSGADHLSGGAGADRIDPSLAGRETRGEDTIPARPHPPARDRIDCGDGLDTATFPEPIDAIANDCDLLDALAHPSLARFEMPLHPARAPSGRALVYVVRMFSPTSLLPVRLEVLDSHGRRIGRSRRVRLRALRPQESGTPIRVQLKRSLVMGRAPVGWHVRVRGSHGGVASVLTLPTRP